MSFKLTWGPFDESFYETIKKGLNQTLNSGPPIPNIVDKLLVHEFCLGDKPPALELLQVADASKEKFKFIFHVSYQGNGLLELRTRVQANPVFLGTSITPSRTERKLLRHMNMGSAMNPHIMPLSIVITDIVFDGELEFSFINNKSIQAFFATDPLRQVNIKTSFDEFPAAANFVKKLVEEQLRNFIMKDFPQIVGAITVPSPASPSPPSPPQQSINSISINNAFFSQHNSNSSNIASSISPQSFLNNIPLASASSSASNSLNSSPSNSSPFLNSNNSSSSRLDSSSSFFNLPDENQQIHHHHHQHIQHQQSNKQQQQKSLKKKSQQHGLLFNEKQKHHPSSVTKESQRMELYIDIQIDNNVTSYHCGLIIAWLNTAPEAIFFLTALSSSNVRFAVGAVSGSSIVVCTIALGFCIWIGSKNRKGGLIQLQPPVKRQCLILLISLVIPLSLAVVGYNMIFGFAGVGFYLLFVVNSLFNRLPDVEKEDDLEAADEDKAEDEHDEPVSKGVMMLVIGGALICFFSKPFIGSIVELASTFNVNPILLAFFLAPIASEMPEILESISLSRKGNSQSINIAYSNLIGGTISKTTLLMGIFSFYGSINQFEWESPTYSLCLALVIICSMLAGAIGYFFNKLQQYHGGLLFGVFVITGIIQYYYNVNMMISTISNLHTLNDPRCENCHSGSGKRSKHSIPCTSRQCINWFNCPSHHPSHIPQIARAIKEIERTATTQQDTDNETDSEIEEQPLIEEQQQHHVVHNLNNTNNQIVRGLQSSPPPPADDDLHVTEILETIPPLDNVNVDQQDNNNNNNKEERSVTISLDLRQNERQPIKLKDIKEALKRKIEEIDYHILEHKIPEMDYQLEVG
ncbi:hypothetical protein PPL_00766 [Heterostelium album PN500]|uniref:SMP-LTD domain-containing protein n=1 Tax=Heterostelium pallidum (strain ATCC 26659 / Pp 5 / PN500) TaxID=670386 RepID=D3AXD5_HETP5|nr:hypothetical protein PPL_00766 [Heterostelium album PN500]EFA86204.1 hypothetical protein PPL_00766 [Heterostelium album PN500]|eukprot:XP_020438309.1 hypothetical protein PPL_00766 [Heterostelium album PN500]